MRRPDEGVSCWNHGHGFRLRKGYSKWLGGKSFLSLIFPFSMCLPVLLMFFHNNIFLFITPLIFYRVIQMIIGLKRKRNASLKVKLSTDSPDTHIHSHTIFLIFIIERKTECYRVRRTDTICPLKKDESSSFASIHRGNEAFLIYKYTNH